MTSNRLEIRRADKMTLSFRSRPIDYTKKLELRVILPYPRLPSRHLPVVRLRRVRFFDHMQRKAIQIDRRFQAKFRGAPHAVRNSDVPWFVKAGLVNSRMPCAPVDWPRFAHEPSGCGIAIG